MTIVSRNFLLLRFLILLAIFQISCGRNLPKFEEDFLMRESSLQPSTTKPICLKKLGKDLEMLTADVEKIEEDDGKESGYEQLIKKFILGKNETMETSTEVPKDNVKSKFQKIIEKIKNFFRSNKSNIAECSAIKRDVSGEEDGEYEVSMEDEYGDYESLAEPTRITASDVEYLKKMIDCFKKYPSDSAGDRISLAKNDDTTKICITFKKVVGTTKKSSTTPEPPQDSTTSTTPKNSTPKIPEASTSTESPTTQEPSGGSTKETVQENNSTNLKLENRLKYMAHLHHPVSLTGKAKQKSLDLKKVQELIDSVKYPSSIFGDDEVENETSKEEVVTEISDVPIFPYFIQDENLEGGEMGRETRSSNIFDSFTKKIKSLVGKDKEDIKEKAKDPGSSDYGSYDYQNPEEDEDEPVPLKAHEKYQRKFRKHLHEIPEESEKIEPKPGENEPHLTEDDYILTDFKDIQQQIDPTQQLDIENFLKQLKDHPKPFQFDVESLMQTKLHEIEAGKIEGEEKKAEETVYGDPNKYFEFSIPDSLDAPPSPPVYVKNEKRNVNYFGDSSRNIERMKNDLIDEYKNNYQNLYRNAIKVDKYKSYLDEDEKKLNDFVDKYYLLNDGASSLPEFTSKDHDTDNINMIDLNIDLKLNKDFQDLEYEQNLKMAGVQANDVAIPPHKLEVSENKEFEGFSP